MLHTLLTETHEELAPLVAEPWVFAAVAAAAFLVMAIATWAHRDVANRHSDKTAGQNPADHGHQSHGPSGANH